MTESAFRYIAGGTLPLNSRCYVDRRFERTAFDALAAGEWLLVLGPRQQGKSSGMVRVQHELRGNGFTCAYLDMQGYGKRSDDFADIAAWIAVQIARDLGSQLPHIGPQEQQDLESWLELALPQEYANVSVVLDEVGAVPEALRQPLFSQLRAIFNRRGRCAPDDLPYRVVFSFVGTFRPERMIDSENSPFNVCRMVIPEDLSFEQVAGLARLGFGSDGDEVARAVFAQVGGQPFLVQSLLRAALAARAEARAYGEAIAAELADSTSGVAGHMRDLRALVLGDEVLRASADRLLAGRPLLLGEHDELYALVSGIARTEGDRPVLRNELYRRSLSSFEVNTSIATVAVRDGGLAQYDLLIVTATEAETRAVQSAFARGKTFYGKRNAYRDLGVYAGARVALVECAEMGSGGSGGATLTVADAVRELRPQSIVVVGIAFGVEPPKQRIGDVLCAERVIDYELQRVGTDPKTGQILIKPRGINVPTSARLRSLFADAAKDFTGRVEFGVMLSGDKLVDHRPFRQALLDLFPDARGGEMEALGAAAAGLRENVDWIILKAYCDWADGKKSRDKRRRQALAADRSAGFLRAAVDKGGFAPGL